ncbi:hypothetical protein [Paraburkholderia dinghuensis]|uniref:Uncharacterized protein n=1 Tax=Paraburkholderia dinghuensis TaxID=2305225 RepID=A0A3N6N0Z9_9BURK|nr:hypothetical protein [Paraburkholderia dinghuensis]RQH09864.1 hypothetical protein D1Y85_01585 [Paraburkholderia dinghuensis]
MTVVRVDMPIGMQLAAVRTLASPIFLTDRRVRAAAIVDDVAARAWGTSAGFAEAACSDVAFLGGAGSEDGPKKGVTTYDATMSGQQAVRHDVATKVTGS